MSWKTLSPESDIYTFDYFCNEDVCRICWCQNAVNEITSISSDKLCKDVETSVTFAEKIFECTGVDLTFNPRPTKICSECCNDIENLFEFRKFCSKTERRLHDILRKGLEKKQETRGQETDKLQDIVQNGYLKLEQSDVETDAPLQDILQKVSIEHEHFEGSIENINPCKESSGLTVKLGNQLIDPNSIFPTESVTKSDPIPNFKIKPETYCTDNLNSEVVSEDNFRGFELEIKNGQYKCFGCEKLFPIVGYMLRHARESCKVLKNGCKCECGKFLPSADFICDHKNEEKSTKFETHLKEYVDTMRKKIKRSADREHKVRKKNCEQVITKNASSEVPSTELGKRSSNTDKERKLRLKIERELVTGEADEFECWKCKMKFASKKLQRKHMTNHYNCHFHSLCDKCGRVFKTPLTLKLHMMTHQGKRVHACPHPHCGYKAVQESSLTYHIRRHTGELPYSCDQCPKRFATNSNFHKHKRAHHSPRGVKIDHQCKQCDKKFLHKESLHQHITGTHERSDPHVCADCGARYLRFKNLQRHLSAKHGKRIRKLKKGAEFNEIEPNPNRVKAEFAFGYEVVKPNKIMPAPPSENKQVDNV